eukprot:9099595-Alexandrium_andersonii.AAC.1
MVGGMVNVFRDQELGGPVQLRHLFGHCLLLVLNDTPAQGLRSALTTGPGLQRRSQLRRRLRR